MAVGTDGFGLIGYRDLTNGRLKVAHCTNTSCTAATATTLDSTSANTGYDTSVTVGADGLGLISYYDQANGRLRVAHCMLTGCAAYARNR